jgi:hypothetical protein
MFRYTPLAEKPYNHDKIEVGDRLFSDKIMGLKLLSTNVAYCPESVLQYMAKQSCIIPRRHASSITVQVGQ